MSRGASALPQPIADRLEVHLGARVLDATPVSGGDINVALRVDLEPGNDAPEQVFVKFHGDGRLPGMFAAEARGLALLRQGPLRVPEPLLVAEGGAEGYEGPDFLALEWVAPGSPAPDADVRFGEGLAALHRLGAEAHGLDHGNYMGSLPQRNDAHGRFVDFFREERLLPAAAQARQRGRLPDPVLRRLESFLPRLDSLVVEEAPALVHGDLWSGNRIHDRGGAPVLIDPAVAFSSREVDLAMTRLFGGFGRRFESAYRSVWPTAPGFDERVPILNLYPLLVHVALFGGGYVNQVDAILRRHTG